ncbi:hypothetical protein [Paenibacillus pabuli]|uniref:hypothetical protein n=1 Tax=Paenibacillus pabuli TaxID=1472 RepID=UPI003CE8A0DD
MKQVRTTMLGEASTYASDKEVNALQGKGTGELSNRQLAESAAQGLQAGPHKWRRNLGAELDET